MSSPGISSAAFPAGLYIATVVLYSCLILPTFYIWRRHGRAGFLAYNFVFSFCAIRIAGGALSMVARHNPNIETSATVVNSLAISPLLLAELGVLHEARNACLLRLEPRVERTLVGGFHSIITTAIILVVIGIVNVVKGLSTTQDSGLIKAGLAMLVVSYLILLAWTTISLRDPARPRNDTFIDGTVLLSLFAATAAVAQTLQCPQNVHGQASQMMASNVARSQGAAASSSGTGLIELGIFYQALRESIAATNNTADKQAWTAYLHNSTATAIPLFTNATSAIELPLDRFSIGTEMMRQSHETQSASLLSAISTLQDSLAHQPRNTNGGLWYYDNRNNLTAYRNLSYTDGMYSYPTFAILSAGNGTRQSDAVGPAAVLKQLEILAAICDDGTGLLVHGYDALKAHGWADPETGASPSVWGRSQAWYTLGVLEALEALHPATSPVMTLDLKIAYSNMKLLFNSLIKAQIVALERAFQINGKYGVWQVVDLPGASINGSRNFIETSASLMTAYSLLKSVRLNILEDTKLRNKAIKAGVGLWENIFETHVTRNANGTLDLGGTSSIASLSPQIVNAKYYFDRPTANNSLIGTSAFTLASLELEKLCG
ncbi:unnamed protein product [Aureobasidium pullulans]|nr:unnamed protein product [Aureobasidium pullulans]